MKFYPLYLLLFWQLALTAQPALTLNYYFQEGLHEYNYYDIDTAILQLEGADVVWDFSNGKFGQLGDYSFSYRFDTLLHSNGYTVLPTLGTVSGLENANRVLTKIRAQGYEDYEVLAIDTAVRLVYEGLLDCDAIGGNYPNTLSPEKLFPTPLAFQETSSDTLQYLINWPTKDTLKSTNSFIYSGYGSFIHPNGATLCDVIQLKRIAPNHNGDLVTTITWYSKEARGPVAILYNFNVRSAQKNRVEIKKIDFANLSFTTKELDTLTFAHTTNNCGFMINFFPSNSCDEFSGEETIHIDIWNDNHIDTVGSQQPLNFLQFEFPIGAHRIIYENPDSKEIVEQIIIIEDKNAPEIYTSCDGSGTYSFIPEDSSSILITSDDLYWRVSDNHCNGTQTFKFWLNSMEEVPNPDSLSLQQILTDLPDSYQIDCFQEEAKHFWGWVYAFDLAGNWSRRSINLTVFSNNCEYLCPTNVFTRLSFQDIAGNPLDQIIAPAYGKEMEIQDNLYLYRVCPTDSTTIPFNFKKTTSVVENVTTFDILLIQKHILGMQPFSTFQQFAAADVNYSGDITAFDLLTIKRTILGFNHRFNGGKNWVFFEKETNLLDKNPYIDVFPLHLMEEKSFKLVDTTYHFLGIKLGDVSGQ